MRPGSSHGAGERSPTVRSSACAGEEGARRLPEARLTSPARRRPWPCTTTQASTCPGETHEAAPQNSSFSRCTPAFAQPRPTSGCLSIESTWHTQRRIGSTAGRPTFPPMCSSASPQPRMRCRRQATRRSAISTHSSRAAPGPRPTWPLKRRPAASISDCRTKFQPRMSRSRESGFLPRFCCSPAGPLERLKRHGFQLCANGRVRSVSARMAGATLRPQALVRPQRASHEARTAGEAGVLSVYISGVRRVPGGGFEQHDP